MDTQVQLQTSDKQNGLSHRRQSEVKVSLKAQLPAESWPRLLIGYTQNATLHGVRFITGESRYLIRNIIWFLIVGLALGFLIFYTYDRVSFYLLFKKNVNVEVNYLQKLEFPAVTFCNQNAFKITAVAEHEWYNMAKRLNANPDSIANRKCNDREFRCGDGTCVSVSKLCDVFPDCKDQSDEQGCEHCPMLLFDGPAKYRSLQPEALGYNYNLQSNTYHTTTPVYIRDNGFQGFLYYQQNRWVVSSQYEGGETYAYAVDAALTPAKITSHWVVKNATSFTVARGVKAKCADKYGELLEEPDGSIVPDLTLDDLYKKTAHQQEDMVKKCMWKGKQCEEGSIHQQLTDMGVCFTYNSRDMFVEQSGPGYGLGLTLNIEQYEYTKSTEDGIGVKLLLHDYDDVPLMKERGTAVSPGLFSFISVETTEVVNLAPPWGTCGEKDLAYYDSYSLAKCKLDCEASYLEPRCNCKDIYMPVTDNSPPYCDVDNYIKCGKPKIDALRADGNCTCPTPCVKKEYVPSTSFSIILGPDTSAGVQDEESAALEKKLFKAREIRHRIVKDKYLQTMRNMHILDHGLKITTRFFEAIRQSLTNERRNVILNTAQINGDCINVRDTLTKAKVIIREQIEKPLQEYQNLLQSKGEMALEEIAFVIDDLLDAANRFRDNPKNIGDAIGDIILKFLNKSSQVSRGDDVTDLTWSEYVSGVLMEKNNTVWTMYTKTSSSLTLFEEDMHADLNAAIKNVSLLPEFRLEKDRIQPLSRYIGNHCPWCSNNTNGPLLGILQQRILSAVDVPLAQSLKTARLMLETAFQEYLANLLLKDNLRTISGWADPEFYSLMNESRAEVRKALDTLSSVLAEARVAGDMIESLLYFVWELQCQTELKRMAKHYEGLDIFSDSLMDETIQYFYAQNNNITSIWDEYINDMATLEHTGLRVPFLNIEAFIANKKLRLESLLTERWLSLQEIHNQIKSIGYSFMASMQGSYLATSSAYWKGFGMSTVATNSESWLDVDGNPLLLPKFYVLPDRKETKEWNSRLDNIQTIKDDLQIQIELLDGQIKVSQAYFDDYIRNNKLSDEFYANNFLQIEVFYKELAERSVSQQKAYEYPNLLSEIGGFMGLLMGASVLSLLEVFDLILYNLCRKCC